MQSQVREKSSYQVRDKHPSLQKIMWEGYRASLPTPRFRNEFEMHTKPSVRSRTTPGFFVY